MKYLMPLDAAYSEVIFAPFHDPEHSPWLNIHIKSEDGTEIVRDSLWDSTIFSWKGAGGRACFTLKTFCEFDVENYDELILCISAPKAALVEVALIDKDGKQINRWARPVKAKGGRQELAYKISALLPVYHLLRKFFAPTQYAGVSVRVTSGITDAPVLSMIWLGLRNSTAFELNTRLREAARPDWSPWILPDEAWGEVRFERGLLFDSAALSGVREKLKDAAWSKHFALLEKQAAGFMQRDPEADFGDYLPTHDARYIREAQHGSTCYHWEALVLAFVGLVREDRAMIRHALRYLMCMVHTRYWRESGEHNIPSSTWSHMCFQEEMTTTSVAILFDWLGFALFPRTHQLVRKVLFEKGMTSVARDLASRDSIHRMNQGAVFNRALILGGLMLEPKWTHFDTQTVDRAYESMSAIVDSYVKPDGGVHEGIGYLCQTMNATLWAMIAYGRARGKDWQNDVRQCYGHVGRYVAAMSAMHPGKAIPAGDCRVEWFGGDALPIMAALCPDSPFADILENCLVEGWVYELTGTLAKSGGLIGMVYGPDKVPASRCVVPAFDVLPESAKVAMTFGHKGHTRIHLWISGHAKNATHAHRDLGQFALELNEEQIFIDRGMVQYWYPEAHFLSQSWMHNVITPVASNGSFPSQSFPSVANLITVAEDQKHIVVPGNDVWGGYMESYERLFEFEGEETFSVIDNFVLSKDGRIAFHLHSPMAFETHTHQVVLERSGYRLEARFPWAEKIECREVMGDFCHRPVFHICVMSPVLKGQCSLMTVIAIRSE